ncbi:cation tolerance protein CutA [Vibrio albus]|uniref:Cation tolerance protein CutA n=1 Tax=Vibrio albus TaxID=2200953 RepID=A0A2U3B8W6_9VIBR|nr:flagellar brake protein [Vibrio albus]PWI33223.1 cation tolerance protein CutA [Vibrio albus]
MSKNAVEAVNNRAASVAPAKGTDTVVNSTDAIDMISHGSELTINITTPVGIKYMGKTKFIGSHSDQLLLLEIPEISEEDQQFFFQEGFWINIRAISQRGEGAIIQFRSQILHIIEHPLPMVMVSIPGVMNVHQLRKEPRYDVNLQARAYVDGKKLECEIRDLSRGGCRFITNPLARNFDVGDKIAIEVITGRNSNIQLPPLKGHVCNLQSSMHYAKYGMQFDDIGTANVKTLLGHLKFNGTKLSLKL